jgi:putative intracellular protease/amidase
MKNVYVLVFDGLADWEIGLITFELNTRNGIKVTTVGFNKEPVRTGGGLKVLPDIALSEIDPENAALLILPGGGMWHDVFPQDLAQVVVRLHEMGVPVAAICGATVFLAKAGILKEGIQHTSNALEYLQQFVPEYDSQASYQDAYAVSDKGIITAGGLASVEFTYQILKTLQVYDDEVLGEFAELWNCRGL